MQEPLDHNRHMAMLKAALPYVMPESRRAIEIMLQADALIHTARRQNDEPYSLEAADISLDNHPAAPPFTPNPETMLQSIREYCTPKEADLIQTILNVLQANRLFRGYREFQKSHPAADLTAAGSSSPSSQLMEFLLSQLAPEQKSTFEQFQQIMYNERCQSPERNAYDTTTTPMAEQ